jgi:hypothetical protein
MLAQEKKSSAGIGINECSAENNIDCAVSLVHRNWSNAKRGKKRTDAMATCDRKKKENSFVVCSENMADPCD